jgi:CoA:oxalate CoA-transferase
VSRASASRTRSERVLSGRSRVDGESGSHRVVGGADGAMAGRLSSVHTASVARCSAEKVNMPPLTGLKVVDLTRVLAGPFCTMMLGDMGAEVLKIEEPELGDESRGWAPFIGEDSSYFLSVNRNKKSIALDLKTEHGRDALSALIATADVLVENFRPGSLAELGFGYRDVSRTNPRLVYCSISGYGQSGPRAELPGYDVVIQGESGFMEVTGAPEGEPTRAGVAITDYLAGLYAAQGILLALYDRQRSGMGQHVDISLYDSMLSVMRLPLGLLLASGAPPARVGNDHPSIAPYETLNTPGGKIIVAVGNPRLWKRFCAAIERTDLLTDERFATNICRLANRAALKVELERTFERFSLQELIDRLQAHKVPCGQVRSIADAIADPQVAARHMLLSMPNGDSGPVINLGTPVKLSRTPAEMSLRPPGLGEHTDEVLGALESPARRVAQR